MTDSNITVCVLGYGCHLHKKMERYLQTIVHFIHTHPVEKVILSGGYTNPISAPGISEAAMMRRYLIERVKVPIILEEASRTTTENLQHINKLFIIKHQKKDKTLVVFCDTARKSKVRILGRIIFGFTPKIQTYSLTTSLLSHIKQIFIATPLACLALYVPFLNKLEIKRRQAIINKS